MNNITKIIEKYLSFTIKKPIQKSIKQELPLVFVDNIHFWNISSGNLVKNKGKNDFYHLNQEFNAIVLDLLKKKGIFPYDYWDSFEKFKGKFYNTLTTRAISDKNYEHALNVLKFLKMNRKFLQWIIYKWLSWFEFKGWCFAVGLCVWNF